MLRDWLPAWGIEPSAFQQGVKRSALNELRNVLEHQLGSMEREDASAHPLLV